MAAEAMPTGDNVDIFNLLDTYPWDKDKEYQIGLSAILGPNPSASQVHELTLRARCFYLSRKKSVPIDFDAYKAYLVAKSESESNPPQAATTTAAQAQPPDNDSNRPRAAGPPLTDASPAIAADGPQYPVTFAQIVEMIQSGADIPGIKQIPDTVLTGQASVPVAPKRRKPWEKDVPDAVSAGQAGGTFGDQRDLYITQELPED